MLYHLSLAQSLRVRRQQNQKTKLGGKNHTLTTVFLIYLKKKLKH